MASSINLNSDVMLMSRYRAARLLALLALAGCAAPPQRQESMTPPQLMAPPQTQAAEVSAFELTGRIGVQHDGDGFSGTLHWHHRGAQDDILISSPLGQGVAKIEQSAAGVVLTTADQHSYSASNAESLSEEVLGWRLPLQGLRYWVTGRPAPSAAAHSERGEDGLLTRLQQDTWQIDYLDYKTVQGRKLPGRIFMSSGNLDVKLLIDSWVIEP